MELYSEAADRLAHWSKDTPDPKPLPAPESERQAENEKIYLVHQGATDVWWEPGWSKFDGKAWEQDRKFSSWGLSVSDGFCLTPYKGKLYMFHRSTGSDAPSAVRCQSSRGVEWTKQASDIVVNTWSSWGMSAVTFKDKLYLFHHGVDEKKLNYNVFDGISWAGDTTAPVPDVAWGLSAVAFEEKLYLFYRHYFRDDKTIQYVVFDGSSWQKQKDVPETCTTWGITAVVYHKRIHLMHCGYEKREKIYHNSFDGSTWEGEKLIEDCEVANNLSSVVHDDNISMFYKGANSSDMYRQIFDGKVWAKERLERVSTQDGIAAVVY
ncbi:BNR repeat-containing protein [Fusarium beomiforme]|uniref:BNR repeat-containing protein n=1 Tax=Fusarium beomiforme TaxID=44412 RepID=A0A9P5DY23_9HYPO|nr:BNR repeat-containing protein [Fusarium beomiforme]